MKIFGISVLSKKNKKEHFIGDLVYHNGSFGLGCITEKYRASVNKNAPWRYDIEWFTVMVDGRPFISTGYSAAHIDVFKNLFEKVQNGEDISAQGW